MDNLDKTRNRFIDSLKQLMEKKQLDKITVKEIVETDTPNFL